MLDSKLYSPYARLRACNPDSLFSPFAPHPGMPIPSLGTESTAPQIALAAIVTPRCYAGLCCVGGDRADLGLFRCCRASRLPGEALHQKITGSCGLYGLLSGLTPHWHVGPKDNLRWGARSEVPTLTEGIENSARFVKQEGARTNKARDAQSEASSPNPKHTVS